MKCKIQWIDENGNLTPDNNEAIGLVWLEAHTEYIHGHEIDLDKGEELPICAEHYKRLKDRGMEWWRFQPFDGGLI